VDVDVDVDETASPEPLVVDVKRNSLDDGPGIRSVVFFKGCPLRCVWCQNPESLVPGRELQRLPDRCVGCGACVLACTRGVARPGGVVQAGECGVCETCVAVCPTAARRVVGTAYDLDALFDKLLRDEPFYRRSGGGVTLSGGEPTLYLDYVTRLAERLAARGVHVLVETCGHFDGERFVGELLPHLGAVYFDVKVADPEAHRRATGRDNRRIRENLTLVARTNPEKLLVRVPLVPGITDLAENLAAIAALLRGLGLPRVALLPYNPLWIPKRRALGLDLPYAHAEWMSEDSVRRCGDPFRRVGLEVLQ
jgi:pyruvate formate lyase activating enzyme